MVPSGFCRFFVQGKRCEFMDRDGKCRYKHEKPTQADWDEAKKSSAHQAAPAEVNSPPEENGDRTIRSEGANSPRAPDSEHREF